LMDTLTIIFSNVGLKMNAAKTKAMVMTGGKTNYPSRREHTIGKWQEPAPVTESSGCRKPTAIFVMHWSQMAVWININNPGNVR
jgi:hypothetical protein